MCPNIDEGVIKYDRSFFTHGPPLEACFYRELERWRAILYKYNLIGVTLPENVGHGNLSYREEGAELRFVITGTQTGKFPRLTGEHYTRVVGVDIEKLKLVVEGPIEASSESLTHGAIYQGNSQIRAVIHGHSLDLWNYMIKNNFSSTAEDTPYGTKEMALETVELVKKGPPFGLFVMKGHPEGVVSYGKNLNQAGQLLLDVLNQI